MEDKLLSISEAARLLNVCENTLRDWDVEGKFKAERSSGGHRRYSLDAIRQCLNDGSLIKREEAKEKMGKALKNNLNEYFGCRTAENNELIKKWEAKGYLIQTPDEEKKNLAILLENAEKHYSGEDLANSLLKVSKPNIFSTEQILWLTQNSWNKVKFKKMVSIQPLKNIVDLVHTARIIKDSALTLAIEEEGVAAKTKKYNFTYFKNGDFEVLKHLYAEAIAEEIDEEIFSRLNPIKLNDTRNDNVSQYLVENFDYLIAPKSIIEPLNLKGLNIDLFIIDTRLTLDTFDVMVVAGKYPTSNLSTPIFCPYLLALDQVSQTKNLFYRTGWFPK